MLIYHWLLWYQAYYIVLCISVIYHLVLLLGCTRNNNILLNGSHMHCFLLCDAQVFCGKNPEAVLVTFNYAHYESIYALNLLSNLYV